jgi:hypothetical protein
MMRWSDLCGDTEDPDLHLDRTNKAQGRHLCNVMNGPKVTFVAPFPGDREGASGYMLENLGVRHYSHVGAVTMCPVQTISRKGQRKLASPETIRRTSDGHIR